MSNLDPFPSNLFDLSDDSPDEENPTSNAEKDMEYTSASIEENTPQNTPEDTPDETPNSVPIPTPIGNRTALSNDPFTVHRTTTSPAISSFLEEVLPTKKDEQETTTNTTPDKTNDTAPEKVPEDNEEPLPPETLPETGTTEDPLILSVGAPEPDTPPTQETSPDNEYSSPPIEEQEETLPLISTDSEREEGEISDEEKSWKEKFSNAFSNLTKKQKIIGITVPIIIIIIILIVALIPSTPSPDSENTATPSQGENNNSANQNSEMAQPGMWSQPQEIKIGGFDWSDPGVSPAPTGYGETDPADITKTGMDGYHWARSWGTEQAGGDLLIFFDHSVRITEISFIPGIDASSPRGTDMWDEYRHPGAISVVCNAKDIAAEENLIWWEEPWLITIPKQRAVFHLKLDSTPNSKCEIPKGGKLLISFSKSWATPNNPTFNTNLTTPGEKPCCTPKDQVAVQGLKIVGQTRDK